MLVIRLSRVGRKDQAHFRLVAAEKSRPVQGKVVERLGHYNPHTNELVVDEDALQKRLDDGAQPSSRVVKILLDEGFDLPDWAKDNLVHKEPQPVEETESAEEADQPTDGDQDQAEEQEE